MSIIATGPFAAPAGWRTGPGGSAGVEAPEGLMIRHTGGGLTQLVGDPLRGEQHIVGLLQCEHGSIRFDTEHPEVLVRTQGHAQTEPHGRPDTATSLCIDASELRAQAMSTFLRFVREGRVRHDHDLLTGVVVRAVIAGMREASTVGAWVDLRGETGSDH